jgi:molybdenum cofactor cytidylyltransferase
MRLGGPKSTTTTQKGSKGSRVRRVRKIRGVPKRASTRLNAEVGIHSTWPMESAVILAAGASTRMRSQKLLLPLGDEPLVRRTVRQICEAGFDRVLVIVGSEHQEVLAALAGLPIDHALNTEYATGMGSSFRTAVEHLGDSAAAMFALADQPFVTTREYQTVLDTYRQHAPGIVSVRYGEVTAPPHLFSREFFPELAQLQHGARPVLERHRDRTRILEFPPELLLDIDTPEDYERARNRLSSGQ